MKDNLFYWEKVDGKSFSVVARKDSVNLYYALKDGFSSSGCGWIALLAY